MSNKEIKQQTEYTEWKKTQPPLRIKCIEDYGAIIMRLIVGGYRMDGEIMLDAIQVVFSELTDSLARGMLAKITEIDRKVAPTDKSYAN